MDMIYFHFCKRHGEDWSGGEKKKKESNSKMFPYINRKQNQDRVLNGS